MPSKQPAYYQLIPQSLRSEVDALLDYVRYFPYQLPTQCPYCGHHSFRQRNQINTLGQPRFECNNCDRNFSQLTGTYFAQLKQIELWPGYIEYRLQGMPLRQIGQKLGMLSHALIKREQIFHKILNERYPKLAAWWIPHQHRQDQRLTKQVSEQQDQFKAFLEYTCYSQTIRCPHCQHTIGRIPRSKHRPTFKCSHCQTTTNLLKNTSLSGLKNIELWRSYVEYLFQGESNRNIMQLLGVSNGCTTRWNKCFISQMQIMKLNNLVNWIEWQRTRHRVNLVWQKRKQKPPKKSK